MPGPHSTKWTPRGTWPHQRQGRACLVNLHPNQMHRACSSRPPPLGQLPWAGDPQACPSADTGDLRSVPLLSSLSLVSRKASPRVQPCWGCWERDPTIGPSARSCSPSVLSRRPPPRGACAIPPRTAWRPPGAHPGRSVVNQGKPKSPGNQAQTR